MAPVPPGEPGYTASVMSASNSILSAAPSPAAAAPSGPLAFRGLWLFSSRADGVFLALPLLFTALTAGVSLSLAWAPSDQVHRFAVWTAQNILGNGTHVVLTFLLFAVHRDVLTAAPGQPRIILAGVLGTLGVAAFFFYLSYVNRAAHAYVVAITFAVFGMHHVLSQHKGIWSLHSLRAAQAGLPPVTPRERKLQQVYVPMMLAMLLARLLFVADSSAPGAAPYLDVGQDALLPHGTLALMIVVWLGYFLLLFRTLLRAGRLSGPKIIYLFVVAVGTGLVLVAPLWGNVLLPAMHGLEYYMITARMLEPREGDAPSRFSRAWIWPAMILAMSPMLALGVMDGVVLGGIRGTGGEAAAAITAHPVMRALTSLGLGVVLAHYFADAFIYRFRIPSIRSVMLRRLGFAPPPAPAPAQASLPTASSPLEATAAGAR
jgi:hypothetical protein